MMSRRKAQHKRLATYCPACGSDIYFRKLPNRGSQVSCHLCHSLLEVKRLAPLTLEWAFEEPFDFGEFVPQARYSSQNSMVHEDHENGEDDASGNWDEHWDDDWDEEEFED
ncbi:MAG TPA: hypothetical protein VLE70_18105 [Anaerolineae bacterium]|nr:hypothetical protein [Anaerolineae bacterium]